MTLQVDTFDIDVLADVLIGFLQKKGITQVDHLFVPVVEEIGEKEETISLDQLKNKIIHIYEEDMGDSIIKVDSLQCYFEIGEHQFLAKYPEELAEEMNIFNEDQLS